MRQRIHWVMIFGLTALIVGVNPAQAQKDVVTTFTSTIQQQFDARSSPAQITSDNESTLLSKGYVKIGSILAGLTKKKADPKFAGLLETAILKKAAESGGDLVLFTENGVQATVEVPNRKLRAVGGCTKYQQVPDGRGGMMQSTNCIQSFGYVQDTHMQHDLFSEASIWRYEPQLAAVIKERAEEDARKAAELKRQSEESSRKAEEEARKYQPWAANAFKMLGKDMQSPEMSAWLPKLGTPDITPLGDSSYYDFELLGLTLIFTKSKLISVYTHADDGIGFKQFQGELPYGLSFKNSRSEVKAILGQPDASGGGSASTCYDNYKSKGILVSYNTYSCSRMDAMVSAIAVSIVDQ